MMVHVCILVLVALLCLISSTVSLRVSRARSCRGMQMFFGGGGGGGGGDSVLPEASSFPRPRKPLILFEYENSQPCKVVRQACQLLDLVVEHRPCPGGRYGFSDNLQTKSQGSRTTPYLIDPGNPIGVLAQAKSSDAIVEYLYTYYGPGPEQIPASLKGKGLSNPSGVKPLNNFNEDNIFLKPMMFYGWESNADCKAVRDVFSGLCIAFVNVNVAKGSKNRAVFEKKAGSLSVPFLEDPNTKQKMSGKAAIKAYLMANYCQGKKLPRLKGET